MELSVFFRLSIGVCLLGSVAWGVGCASLAQRGPVAENVITSRQLTHRGIDLMQRGRMTEAEQQFRRAIAVCPTDAAAHRHLGEVLWRRGAADDAIVAMQEAVRLSGNDPELLVALGEMHLVRGELDAAERGVNLAIRGNPLMPEAWMLKGDVLRRQGADEDALAAYHRALSYRSDHPAVQMRLAELYFSTGRPHRTLAAIQAIKDQSPSGEVTPQTLLLEGKALIAMGRPAEAAERLAAASSAAGVTADVFYEMARAELYAGRPTAARWAAQRALEMAPQHGAAREMLAEIDLVQQRMAARTGP